MPRKRLPITCNQALILLPQSALRFWGIEGIEKYQFNQIKLPIRSDNDLLFESAYYKINELIIEQVSSKIVKKIEIQDIGNFDVNNSLIDCQILNIVHHFPKLKNTKKLMVMDYSSLGYRSIKVTELKYPKIFIRSFLRNLKFFFKFQPRAIVHWDDFAKNSKALFTKMFWHNYFVDTKRIKVFSRKFLEKHKDLFLELSHVKIDDSIVLIAPHQNENLDQLNKSIFQLIDSNPDFKSKFRNAKFVIIKQHKSSKIIYPANTSLCNKPVIVMQSLLSRVVPLEILAFGFKNSFLASCPSSALFSHSNSNSCLIPTSDKNYLIEYGLMLKRKKYTYDHSFRFQSKKRYLPTI